MHATTSRVATFARRFSVCEIPLLGSPVIVSVVLGALLFGSPATHAAGGDPDPNFGTGGSVTTPIGADDDRALAAIQFGPGIVLAAGWTFNGTNRDVALAAYDEVTGALLGIVTTPVGTGDDIAEAIILDPDGRPVIAGWTENGGTTDILLIRYDGGVPDPAFGTSGIVRTPVLGGAKALALMVHDGDGIVVTGQAGNDIFVARYDLNGQPDPAFGTGGITITPAGGPAAANAVAAVGLSDILVAGWVQSSPDADILQARYRNNGTLRSSFGVAGIAVTSLGATDDVAEALAIDGNRAYIAGWSGTQVMLAKYNFDGDLVTAFDGDGIVQRSVGTEARALSVTVEQDGSVLAAGWASMGGAKTFLVLHHLADGSPDSTIGTDGVVTIPIGSGDSAAEAVIALADESRIAFGWGANGSDDDFAAVRYLRSPRCGNGIPEPEGGETCDHGPSDSCCVSCQLQPAGTSCSSDGDPCTEDYCDGAGFCVHPAAQAACGPQLCYRGSSTDFASSTPVSLNTVLHVGQVSAQEPRAFCLPAGVDGVPVVVDATLGQTVHRLDAPRHRPRQNVSVYDRFGLSRLSMQGASRLLAPTRVSQGSPPLAPPPDGAANFFECYGVRRAAGAPPFPDGVQATVVDALTNRSYEVRRPKRLCVPAEANGATKPLPAAYLLCYTVRPAAGGDEPLAEPVYTASALDAGRFDNARATELCVPSVALPCDTLPPCVPLGGQSADCTYTPVVVDPLHLLCQGPTVLIDATHANFHTLETDGVAGRYWGFARLLSQDGYVVMQSERPVESLLPHTDAAVLVIANPDLPGVDAVPAEEVPVIAAWVRQGGSLLLSIDHEPYGRVAQLLAAFGLDHLPAGDVAQYTFTSLSGDLPSSEIAAGPGLDTAVDEVTTFRGTAFRIAANPPPEAQFEPVLDFPPGVLGFSSDGQVDLGDYLQGVAIRFGAGRVYVSGESGGLTAQGPFGMHFTPDNERFLRNILWWLTQ